jgi:hypothetical protein
MILPRRFSPDFKWAFISLVFLCGIGWFVNSLNPNSSLVIGGMLSLIAAMIFSILSFFRLGIIRRLLYTGVIILYLFLRLLGLTDWYYPLFLVIATVSIDMYFKKSPPTGGV